MGIVKNLIMSNKEGIKIILEKSNNKREDKKIPEGR